jgi:hypothetical protein
MRGTRRHIPGAEARFSGWYDAWAKAQAYLRGRNNIMAIRQTLLKRVKMAPDQTSRMG